MSNGKSNPRKNLTLQITRGGAPSAWPSDRCGSTGRQSTVKRYHSNSPPRSDPARVPLDQDGPLAGRDGGVKPPPRRAGSEFEMEADAGDDDGAAGLVVAGVGDALDVEGQVGAAPDVGGVVELKAAFVAVGERAIAQQKAQSTVRQVLAVVAGNSQNIESETGAVVGAMPASAVVVSAEVQGPIRLRIRPAFG